MDLCINANRRHIWNQKTKLFLIAYYSNSKIVFTKLFTKIALIVYEQSYALRALQKRRETF